MRRQTPGTTNNPGTRRHIRAPAIWSESDDLFGWAIGTINLKRALGPVDHLGSKPGRRVMDHTPNRVSTAPAKNSLSAAEVALFLLLAVLVATISISVI